MAKPKKKAEMPKLQNEQGRPTAGRRGVGRPISGEEVIFRTPGGREVGSGGLASRLIRRITGQHRSDS